jgi:hypothetical protein
VQVVVVEPMLNIDPLGGVHVTATGAVPPVTVAEPKVTKADCPFVVVTGNGATGHATAGGGMMMVFDGPVGLLHMTLSDAKVASPIVAARRERA